MIIGCGQTVSVKQADGSWRKAVVVTAGYGTGVKVEYDDGTKEVIADLGRFSEEVDDDTVDVKREYTKKVDGFVAFEDGEPVEMELSDDIMGGLTWSGDPFPVFKDSTDAEEAVMSNQSRYGSVATFEIRKVTIEVGEVVNTVTYDENADEDEDQDEEDEDS